MSFEKVNPSHPDKVADRIAGAIVDLAYKKSAIAYGQQPKIAVEVLIGHGSCHIMAETSIGLMTDDVLAIVSRITGLNSAEDCFESKDIQILVDFCQVPQDEHLAKNQDEKIKCGDNGIFKGVLTSAEENLLTKTVKELYAKFPTDGKFIYTAAKNGEDPEFIGCQSNVTLDDFERAMAETTLPEETELVLNPLGEWTGGTNVDTGATNRKLGSDMGRAVTGGGLHGKDLSKADVSVNIVAHLYAQKYRCTVDAVCAIGDEAVAFTFHRTGAETITRYVDYADIVNTARDYINDLGGFEKLAEWGLIR